MKKIFFTFFLCLFAIAYSQVNPNDTIRVEHHPKDSVSVEKNNTKTEAKIVSDLEKANGPTKKTLKLNPTKAGLANLKPLISYGGSPRASINMAHAARAIAMLQQRAYVIPDDVKQIAADILRHRIGLTYEAEAESINAENVIGEILRKIPAP